MIVSTIRQWFTRSASVATDDALYQRASMAIAPTTIDEGARTVRAIAATDQPVLMFDFERGELVHEILVAEGGTFPDRIPMLDHHDRSSVTKVLGSGFDAKRNGGQWDIALEFDDDEPSENAFRKVRKKHINDVSVGYSVQRAEYIMPGRTKTVAGKSYTATNRTLKVSYQWQANEISLAPIGADRDAKIRSLFAGKNPPMQHARNYEFAAELNDLVDELGIDRAEVVSDLSETTGLNPDEMTSVFAGELIPSDEQMESIANVLETDPAELAGLV